jgi:hypothetical protein
VGDVKSRIAYWHGMPFDAAEDDWGGLAVAARDRFMQGLMKWQAKQGTSEKPYEGPMFTEAARFSLLLDGIKLIGTGNGAGGFASVAALYYFSSRPELHLLIKIAAIFFVVGLLIFAVAIAACVLGLSAATRFVDQYRHSRAGSMA